MNFYLMMSIFILIGLLTGYCAQRRGRDAKVWFLIGFLFGLIGLGALFLFPRKDMEEVPNTESLNTSKPIEDQVEPPRIESQSKEWFYLDKQNNQFGPITFESLKEKLNSGIVDGSTYVWTEGMENWMRIRDKLKNEG